MAAVIGESAPDFSLLDQHGNTVTKADLRGDKALVVFIPFAFSPTCHGELCTIRDNLGAIDRLGAKVVVITCDSPWVNRRWSEENEFAFPILSDFWPHGSVAIDYGCFNQRSGGPFRSTYVLDPEGVVGEIVRTDSTAIPREFERYEAALATLSG